MWILTLLRDHVTINLVEGSGLMLTGYRKLYSALWSELGLRFAFAHSFAENTGSVLLLYT